MGCPSEVNKLWTQQKKVKLISLCLCSSGLTINGANITSADVLATNGVIQELDGVLDPDSSP